MSLPLAPPPQRLAVDDVLAVEVITDADTGFSDAKTHLAREHKVAATGTDTGRHSVITIPIASAIFRVPSDFHDATDDGSVEPVAGTVLGAWSKEPRWRRTAAGGFHYGFEFEIGRPWYAIRVAVRGTSGELAFGWYSWKDSSEPRKGNVVLPRPELFATLPTEQLDGVTHILLLVYGDA